MAVSLAGCADKEVLASLKEISGRAIERERRRRHMTQSGFASDVGLSVRWLRELEGGNPASTLDDHLLCARCLGIPLGQMLFPLLYLSRGLTFPLPLAHLDMIDLERRCCELIAERNTRILRDYLAKEPHRSTRGSP
jgi:transcriptional regulator with XRE-family HTH domain